jgi:dihydroorotase
MVGHESALPIALLALVNEGHVSWAEVERLLSQKPAEIGRLRETGAHPAALEPGQPADLVLVDPSGSSVFDLVHLHGRSINSPYLGMELPGRVHSTIRRGYLTLDDGELVDAESVAGAARASEINAGAGVAR